MKKKMLLIAGVCLALSVNAFCHGDHGKAGAAVVATMKTGDFSKALKELATEIKEHPDSSKLKKLYSNLKTNMRRQELFDSESNPGMVNDLGKNLRKFYYSLGLYNRAESIDRKVYKMSPTAGNAISLIATLLNQEKNSDAAAVFAKLDASKCSAFAKLCGALAYARTGKTDEAKSLLKSCDINKIKRNELMVYARVTGLLKDTSLCSLAVASIMGESNAKQQAGLKKFYEDSDFNSVRDTEPFKKALQTPPAADDCASCPNRGTDKCDGGHDHN